MRLQEWRVEYMEMCVGDTCVGAEESLTHRNTVTGVAG